MNILLLYNDFDGAYNSLGVFQKELILSIQKNDKILISHTVKDTLALCKNNPISFTIGIGMFNQYIDDIPVYELTGVHHYQWIIDSPFKMNMDYSSEWITYIFINRGVIYNLQPLKNEPMFLPLGFCNSKVMEETNYGEKLEGLVFTGQIKEICMEDVVKQSDSYGVIVKNFINDYMKKLDESFEKTFSQYFGEFNETDQKKLFRLTNSFFRALKRKKVVESITEYPVYIIGEVQDDSIKKRENIHICNKLTYDQTCKEISKYRFSLNVDPNYSDAIHDRLTRSIMVGTLPLTAVNLWCSEVYDNSILYYDFHNLQIDDILKNCDYHKYLEMICDAKNRSFSLCWEESIKKIKERVEI